MRDDTLTSFCAQVPGLDPLSLVYKPSIVGAGVFHFSVRNGKRWFHTAQKTESFSAKIDIRQNVVLNVCEGSSHVLRIKLLKVLTQPYLSIRLFSTIRTRLMLRLLAGFVAKLMLSSSISEEKMYPPRLASGEAGL